ncbi:hypothetical protein Tco_1258821, partial [Tanacetum coccineum]
WCMTMVVALARGASGVVDLVDPSGWSNFGLRRNTHRKSFPPVVNGGGGGRVALEQDELPSSVRLDSRARLNGGQMYSRHLEAK